MALHTVRWPGYLTALNTLIRREITRFLRIWTQTLLPSAITMALYFAIFGKLIGSRIGEMNGQPYINYIVPGLIMMSIITNAYTNTVFSFFNAKFQRNIEEMLVAPMPYAIVIWGYLFGGIARGVAVGITVALVARCFTEFPIQNLSLTFVIGVLTALLFSLAGLLNGIFAKKFDDVNIVPTFLLTPLTYLAGVFYAISLLPPFWQKATLFNPIFYMVNAFRYAMSGQADVEIGYAFLVIFSLILIFYSLVLFLFKKGIGILNA